MLEFIFIIFIGAFCLLGWIVGSIKEAKEKRERSYKASIIRMGISDIYHRYPRAFYIKFKKHYSDLDEWELLKAGDVSDSEWKSVENIELKKEADKFYDNWLKKQTKFSNSSRDAVQENWSCYYYYFTVQNHLSNSKSYQFKIWNHFREAFHNDPTLDYSTRKRTQANIEIATKLKECGRYFYDKIYDSIFDLINQLQEKVAIVVADSGLGDKSGDVNNYHFKYLKDKLGDIVDWMTIDEYVNMNRHWPTYIVILEVVTSPQSLINNCNKVLQLNRNWNVTHGAGYPHMPLVPIHSTLTAPVITYISLMKEYTHDEIQELIDGDHKRIEEQRKAEEEKAKLKALEEEKKERERIEKERIERERKLKEAQENERKRTAETRLKQSTIPWYIPSKASLRCYSMYYYYPTTCEFSASQTDWDIRNLIWDFKANPNKPMSIETIIKLHENATNEIVDDMATCLNHFFSDDVKYLTLVCVPSSKEIIHKRRFQDFSEQICRKTSMENGFDYIHVTSDGDAKHMGGVSSSSYAVDSEFFKGKHVLIFDDVITSGRSMERLRIALQSAGANVIGGFSIGRTKHEKQSNHPFYVLGTEQQEDSLDDLPF